MNQTMKIREHTWTPVTITEVLTIPAAEQEKRKQQSAAARVLACISLHLNMSHKQNSSHTDGTVSHLWGKTHTDQNLSTNNHKTNTVQVKFLPQLMQRFGKTWASLLYFCTDPCVCLSGCRSVSSPWPKPATCRRKNTAILHNGTSQREQ